MSNENEQILIKGVLESIIYHNEQNGYSVFSVTTDDEREEALVCVGNLVTPLVGENILMEGRFIVHPSYGKQFSITSYKKTIPSSVHGIEKYLASGVIKGIGAKTAKRIVEKFGKETLDIIEEYPERLAEIKGISISKANAIGAIFHEQIELRQAMLYLQDFGITPIFALKIYKKYKEATIQMVKTNPYSLCEEITGIGFKTADAIAYKVGIAIDSPYRIRAGIKFILSDATTNGHIFLPKELLLQGSTEILSIPENMVEDELSALQIERVIWQEKIDECVCIYLNRYYYAENYIAKKLLELSANVVDKSGNIEKEIAKVEKNINIVLAKNQKKAVAEAMSHGVLVVTGGPGTGKTTTINTIIQILKNEGNEIELAAPTGRAAKRMSEATGLPAKTIHRMLGINFLDDEKKAQKFDKDEETPIETDVLIIDEVSMVDTMLMYNLLKAVSPGTRLVLVGDKDQLPSVGPGKIIKDIISSECIKIITLNEIFRQAQESAIVMNAHKINKGIYPTLNEKSKDFFFVKRQYVDEVVSTIADLIINRLPSFVEINSVSDFQVLTPMRKSPIGVANLNFVLQNCLNPKASSKNEKEVRNLVFREGDKVMQIKNNYNMQWSINNSYGAIIEDGVGIFNGDEGIIQTINNEDEFVIVKFYDDKLVKYDFSQLDEIELSYAITIHKSQGSEYKVVIIPVHNGPPMLMTKNLLYTAVTRAKQLVVIVGITEMLNRMVDNDKEINRYSTLDYRLKKMNEFLS